jgi:hypothetical protein
MQAGRAIVMASLAALLGACSPPPPPPKPPEPPPAPVDTTPPEPVKVPLTCGLECVKSEAECDGGVCKLTIKNSCEQPVTLDLFIVASCKSGTAMVEAKARKRETFAAKTDGEMALAANCSEGEVVLTEAKELLCQ